MTDRASQKTRAQSIHLAVDLGASSGRVIAGVWDGRSVQLEIIHRFENRTIARPAGTHWDLPATFEEIVHGIGVACARYDSSIRSLAVDTWGVDYGLLDESGKLLNLPWMYRDARTCGWMEKVFQKMPRREIYDRTGIQFLEFNTLYQLAAEFDAAPDLSSRARRLLFIPDLIAYWLTGQQSTERTIAGTSQLLKAGSPEWDRELAAAAGIPAHLFHETIEPGARIGELLPAFRQKTGSACPEVFACAAHDTASAVIGVPSAGENPLFLSSGTWSLIGRETDAPILTDASYHESYSNEHGIAGTTRFLKNVSGMWLLQECLRCWQQENPAVSLDSLLAGAERLGPPMRIDPDDDAFLRPPRMPDAINARLQATGQRAAGSREEMVAVVLRSLAARYAAHVGKLRAMTGELPPTLHIVGGGSQNALLNQLTADATGLHVVAGPTEATAMGNVIAQLLATGEISSLAQGREIVQASSRVREFEPARGREPISIPTPTS